MIKFFSLVAILATIASNQYTLAQVDHTNMKSYQMSIGSKKYNEFSAALRNIQNGFDFDKYIKLDDTHQYQLLDGWHWEPNHQYDSMKHLISLYSPEKYKDIIRKNNIILDQHGVPVLSSLIIPILSRFDELRAEYENCKCFADDKLYALDALCSAFNTLRSVTGVPNNIDTNALENDFRLLFQIQDIGELARHIAVERVNFVDANKISVKDPYYSIAITLHNCYRSLKAYYESVLFNKYIKHWAKYMIDMKYLDNYPGLIKQSASSMGLQYGVLVNYINQAASCD